MDSHQGVPNVAAVVTVYNPGPNLVELCRELIAQTRTVVVVDDGSPTVPAGELEHCAALGCVIVRHSSNLGVAAALNTGLSAAMALSPRPIGVVTLDQDSRVPGGYVFALLDAYARAAKAGIAIGMVAPEFIEGLPSHVRESRRGIVLGNEPIQSGLLIPTAAIDTLGVFLESLFIDAVDTEYFLRARSAGLDVVVAPGVALGHSLGSRFFPEFFGRRVRIRGAEFGLVISAPFRYYYIARNHVAMVRTYGRTFPRWAVRESLLDLRHFIILLMLVPGRRLHLRILAAGWRDGFSRVGGKIPEQLR